VRIMNYVAGIAMIKRFGLKEEPGTFDLPGGGKVTHVSGFDALDKIFNNSQRFSAPSGDDLSLEDALAIAIKAICGKYGETEEAMSRFRLEYGFTKDPEDNYHTPYWQFDFSCSSPLDHYGCLIQSPDGKVLITYGPEDSNG
jgi:hypothetical protein